MGRRRVLPASIVLAVGFLLSAGVASADTLDQQQTEAASGYSLKNEVEGAISLAQTFTAGLTGGLDRVELSLDAVEAGAPITVEITTVNGDDAPSATLLASATIPAASIPPCCTTAFVPVSFPTPAPVLAGMQYGIVAYTAEGVYEWGGTSSNGPYAGGEGWYEYSSPPTTMWESFAPSSIDFAFKTYVTVAAPKCSMAVGRGRYLHRGEQGQLQLSNNLSTNLAAKQRLTVTQVTGGEHFHLVKLTSATCEGEPGKRVFHGEGTAAKGKETGDTVSFSISESAGGYYFEATLMKGAEVKEATGGPLRTLGPRQTAPETIE